MSAISNLSSMDHEHNKSMTAPEDDVRQKTFSSIGARLF